MNKKGNVTVIIIFVGSLLLLLLLGLLMVFGSMTFNWIFDEAVPELTNLGEVGNANLSKTVSYGLDPVNNFVQSWTWMAGLLYVLGLIGCLGLAFMFRNTGEKWTIAFFFGLAIILIITSIFVSNIYEDFYDDGDADVSARLQEHTLLSWMLLYSPAIMTLVVFIGGIIIFTGDDGGLP